MKRNEASAECFRAVKKQISAREAAEAYGRKVGTSGMAICPFHNDHHPSLKLDTRFHCFGCQADGDVIDFTALLFGISRTAAVKKLAADFSLPLPADHGETAKERKIRTANRTERRVEEKFNRWRIQAISRIRPYVEWLRERREALAPSAPEDDWDPEFMEAMKNIDRYDYYLDVLCLGTEDEQRALFDEIGEAVRIIERRQGEFRGPSGSGAGRRGAPDS